MGIHRVAFQAAEIMLKYIIVASVVCALDTEKPPMKPKPPMEPKDSASLIDDMLDEHATLNEDLDAKQRTEMHDLAELTIRTTITATTRATSGGLAASSSATAISV